MLHQRRVPFFLVSRKCSMHRSHLRTRFRFVAASNIAALCASGAAEGCVLFFLRVFRPRKQECLHAESTVLNRMGRALYGNGVRCRIQSQGGSYAFSSARFKRIADAQKTPKDLVRAPKSTRNRELSDFTSFIVRRSILDLRLAGGELSGLSTAMNL